MATNGKVQVQRVVHRAGKTFTQMFWVNPSEVKATDRVITPESEQSKPTLFFMDDLTRIANTQGREAAIAAAQAFGIVWKHSDNPGINWMRCSMAVKKASGMQSSTQTDKPSGNVDTSNKSSVITPELAAQVNAATTSKQKIAILVSAMGRGGVMKWAKDNDITWKESDNPGINWMRCSMALREVFPDKGYISEPVNTATGNTENTESTATTSNTSEKSGKSQGNKKSAALWVIPNDTEFDSIVEQYQSGAITDVDAKSAIRAQLLKSGVDLTNHVHSWESESSVESMSTVAKTLDFMARSFPGMKMDRVSVENPYVSAANKQPTVFSGHLDALGVYCTGHYQDGKCMPLNNSSDPGEMILTSKSVKNASKQSQSKLTMTVSHECTHALQYSVAKDTAKSLSEADIDAAAKSFSEQVLLGAVKYLPEDLQAKYAGATAKSLAVSFSPTIYGKKDVMECMAECVSGAMSKRASAINTAVFQSLQELWPKPVDSPLTESKPESTVKTYTPPVMQNHVYMDTPLNKALEAYYNGDYTDREAREVMHKAMQDMGVTLDNLISDWDDIPLDGICTLGEALSAVRDEFPQIGKGHIYVENTANLKKKHLSSFMTRHPGSHNPFIGYATLAPLAFSKTGEVRSGDNFYVEDGNVDSEWGVSFCSDKGYDIADITHDDVIDKGHIQFDACHELTHIVQYEMGRMVLRSMMSTASEDNATRWNNSYNIHKYTEKACELVLRNAIKYLPPEEQAKAKRKRTGKGLAEVFSPTSYGCTNELECIAEAMACHYTGTPRKNDSRKRCEMVYISLREIFDRLLDDPASVKADLDKLKG